MSPDIPQTPPFPGQTALASAVLAHGRWRPGLPPTCHNEIFVSSTDGGGAGAALAMAMDGLRASGVADDDPRAVLWVQDKGAMRLSGRPYFHGLPESWRGRVVHVATQRPEDALFALEEGLRCRDLACVIGEIAGNPRALDFTASRRLSLVAEKHGVPLYLIRLDARRELGAARMRWAVRSASSAPARWDDQAPGAPQWQAELFRARGFTPGEWVLRDDGTCLVARRKTAAPAPDHGDLAGPAGDRPLATF
jgi:protein ImuA